MTNLLDLLYTYMMTLSEIYSSLWRVIDPNSNSNFITMILVYMTPVVVSMILLFRKKESINAPVYEVFAVVMSVIPLMFLMSTFFRNPIGSPIKEGETMIVTVLFALTTIYFIYIIYRMIARLKKTTSG